MERVRGWLWRRVAARRFADERGQSFAEWAVSAGILAALGIAISLTLNATMKTMVRGIANAVRTIAP